jgi:hypothetical protein
MHTIQPMSEDQAAIRDAVAKTLEPFDDAYWARTDETGDWPEEFCAAMAKGGWLGIAMPEEVWRRWSRPDRSGDHDADRHAFRCAGFSGCLVDPPQHLRARSRSRSSARPEQKQESLPKIISGQEKMCFAVTEPNSGLDTSSLETKRRAHQQWLRHQRPEDLDHRCAACGQDPDDRAHHAEGQGRSRTSACRCSTPISTATASKPSRSRKWAARPSSATCCTSTTCRSPERGADRRRGRRASNTCCKA